MEIICNLKHHCAYAAIGLGRFKTDNKNLEKQVKKYLEKNKKFQHLFVKR